MAQQTGTARHATINVVAKSRFPPRKRAEPNRNGGII
jgi:hypothetical protein